jgi:hypothetical protein
MAATWLASPLIALIRPAVGAVAGDIFRRWRIQRKFVNQDISESSPVMKKALKDLDILIGNEGLVTQSVADVIEDLKSTGLLELIARDAFYEINDDGIRVYFEAMYARHSPQLDRPQQETASRNLYATIRFMLRESIRAQINNDLLFIYDTTIKNDRARTAPAADQMRAVLSQIRPDIVKRIGLAGHHLSPPDGDSNERRSGLNRHQFPSWVYLQPEQLKQQIKAVSDALIGKYEYVRLDGPAERTIACEIDKLYVPARLVEAEYSIKAHALQSRDGRDLSIADLLAAGNQCVVVGDPGGGKSTLAQRICLDALRVAAEDGRSPLAVRVELRRFVRTEGAGGADESLIDFISSEIARQGELPKDQTLSDFVRHIFLFGRMIVVFDGIDEIISAAKRRQVIDAAQHLANRFLQVRFIYTCRRTDFLTTPIKGVQLFILQQFNLDEVGAYFRSASKHVFEFSEGEIALKEPPFIAQAKQHASEFIVNPLLLALLVWIYNVGQRIPDNRIELYRECSELLFRRWDSLKEIDPELPDPHWLFQLVTEIAHRLYLINPAEDGDSTADWLRRTALNFFRGVYDGDIENRARAASDRFVGHLIGRSWVLQERAAGTFEFTHRTFMEYYFALWLHDFYDCIQLLFDFVAPRIRAGEWTVPIHLAFQMKSAGKLRSAEALTGALIKLVEQTHSSDLQWKEADSAKQRELKSAGYIAKNYPEVPKVLQFIVGSIGYLQPSEASLARLTRALTHSVSNKNEWFSVVGGLVASPTEFQASIAEGIYQSLADDIAGRKGYSVGYVVDWLYTCYLSGRTRHSVSFPTHVLRFSDVRKRFGERFLSRIQEGRGSTSLPKITFDLTGSTIASVADAGLAMWSASIVPDRRIDWRFIDFGLGLMESIDVLLGQATGAECPYVAFFATLAGVVPEQRDYPISGGLGVLASFDCGGARDVAGRLQTCEIEVALSLAVSIIGFTDMSLRLKISPTSADDVETVKRAEQLGMCPSLRKSEADDVLRVFLGREDIPDDFRDYVRGWIDGEFSMFRPSVRTEYVNHRQAFSGLKEAS